MSPSDKSGPALGQVRPDFIPHDRYTSRAFAQLEKERLWTKTWLWACREEEIPKVGDYYTFDIADQSVILVRSEPDTIRAFHNVCPHRGRAITSGCGHAKHLHCAFHAWQWHLDGSIKRVLDRDDWSGCDGMADGDLHLVDVRVGRWGGFVFINMDPAGESFESFIEPVPEYLNCMQFETMGYCWHKTVKLKANWKVAQEAFMESYHVMGTHPQFLAIVDEKNISQAQGKHGHHLYLFERPPGAPSRRTGQPVPEDMRAAFKGFLGAFSQVADKTGNGQQSLRSIQAGQQAVEGLPAGATPEEVMGAAVMAMYAAAQADGAHFPLPSPEQQAAMGVDWNIFPNLSLVYGFDGTLIMRARPLGDDPDACLLDLCAIINWGEGKAPPLQRQYFEDWRSQPDEIPYLLAQDLRNMEQVQKGLHSIGLKGLRPSPLQEKQISHFHQVLDGYLGEPPREVLRRVG